MAWQILIHENLIKTFRKFPKNLQDRLLDFLEERINKKGRNPTSFGESLTGNLAGLWRYKVGDYRLICDIQKDILVVLILEADHRKQVYRKVKKS